MDDMIDMEESSEKGMKSWSKTVNYEDGGYKEIRVKQVDNGFIKTVTKNYSTTRTLWKRRAWWIS
jgi:hypothetical protein